MKSLYRELLWMEANKEKEDGEYREFKYENEMGVVKYGFFIKFAGCVDGIDYYDISSYRGAQGPYIEAVRTGCEECLLREFKEEFTKYCTENNVIAEFSKLDPWDEYAEYIREIYGGEYYGDFYCNNLETDFYNMEYNRRAKRSIKKAIKAGIVVEKDFLGNTIPEFIRLYKNTENKFNTSNYYKFSEEDIKKYFEIFEGRAFLINALLKGEIITSVVVIMGEDVMHYLFLGANPEYSDLQANSLLTYEAALYGQSSGKKCFDMGGGKPGGGIEQFKLNFAGEEGIIHYYVIKRIYNNDIYEKLVAQKSNILNPKFFPLYRG